MSLFQLARDEDVDGLRDALATSATDSVRERAAELLGEVAAADDRATIDALVRAVGDDVGPVRVAAVDSLTELGPAAEDALFDDLLGRVPGEGADWARAEALAQTLDSDTPAIRMASANALGRLGVPDATPALVDRLDDTDPRVRERVARACASVGDPRAGGALVGRLDDEVVAVRVAATDGLTAVGGQDGLAGLLEASTDSSSRVRHAAVTGLGEFGHLDVGRPLDAIARALDDPDEGVRRVAVFAALELLSGAPAEESHDLREAVLERLEADSRGDVVQPLAETLAESEGAPQRRNAAWLLGRVTDERGREPAIDALADALDDEDASVVQFAATSLVELGGSDVASAAVEALDDAEATAQSRAKAAFVLGRVGGDDARRRLDSLVDETEDEDVRRQAFAALSKLGGEPA